MNQNYKVYLFLWEFFLVIKDVPGNIGYDVGNGVTLTVETIGGVRVFSTRLVADPQCFDIWGGSLTPSWSAVNCY